MTILAAAEKAYTSTNYFGVSGNLTGTTSNKEVALFNRSTFAFISKVTSASLKYGFYDITYANAIANEYFVVAIDSQKIVNGAIADRPPCTFTFRSFS